MDALTNINSILPPPAAAPSIPLPAPTVPVVQSQDSGAASFDPQAAEQNRLATVQKASQAIANVYVLGDQSITIFKDVTGQYITRYTSLRDGKVTYIPEPTVMKMSDTGSSSSLNVTA